MSKSFEFLMINTCISISFLIVCTDDSLSHITSKETMENNGWVVDVTYHNTISQFASCDSSTFYGSKLGLDVAQVTTKFRSNGGAKMVVGNCWNSGFVSISINNVQIRMLRARSREVVKFHYRMGDVLEIKTISLQTSAIMAIYSFETTDWGIV